MDRREVFSKVGNAFTPSWLRELMWLWKEFRISSAANEPPQVFIENTLIPRFVKMLIERVAALMALFIFVATAGHVVSMWTCLSDSSGICVGDSSGTNNFWDRAEQLAILLVFVGVALESSHLFYERFEAHKKAELIGASILLVGLAIEAAHSL